MAESLARGVIDGALIPWEVVPATKAHELTRFHLEPGGAQTLTTATSVFLMNRKKYESLPAELRQVIDDNSGRETSAWVSGQFKGADVDGRAAALAHGNAVTRLDEDELAHGGRARGGRMGAGRRLGAAGGVAGNCADLPAAGLSGVRCVAHHPAGAVSGYFAGLAAGVGRLRP